jgi:ATP-dependent DNA ligase
MSGSGPALGSPSAASAADGWRPQRFSEIASSDVVDPIVEPLWTGLRVTAFVTDGSVEFRDLDGDPVDEFPEVADELLAANRAGALVIDGYLTHQPIQDLQAIARRDSVEDPQAAPTAGQMWFGRLGRRRPRKPLPPPEDTGREPLPLDADVAFVAVDLVWLDDESLLDIPLLERKRVLESVLGESHLVRRGIYVRPPLGTWLGSWRSMGFSRLAYKAANSRYLPGETNSQWALGDLPSR